MLTRISFYPSEEQVETLLKTQDPPNVTSTPDPKTLAPIAVDSAPASRNPTSAAPTSFTVTNPSINIASDRDMERWQFNGESPQTGTVDDFNFNSNMSMGLNNVGSNFTWEMIGLGLEEPLPPQETIDELFVPPILPRIQTFSHACAF